LYAIDVFDRELYIFGRKNVVSTATEHKKGLSMIGIQVSQVM